MKSGISAWCRHLIGILSFTALAGAHALCDLNTPDQRSADFIVERDFLSVAKEACRPGMVQ